MRLNELDDRTANRLLAGAVTPEDAPPGYAPVAQLFDRARPRPAAAGLPGEAATVAAMRSAIEAHPAPDLPQRKHVLKRIVSTKVAAAAAVLAFSAAGAAAATGSLPGPAQQTASDALAKVGISVPGADEHPDNGTTATTPDKSGDHGPDKAADDPTDAKKGPNEHATFGQCTAAEAHDDHGGPTSTTVSPETCSTVVHPGKGNGKPEDHGNQGDENHTSIPGGPPTSTPESDHAADGHHEGDDHSTSTTSPTATTEHSEHSGSEHSGSDHSGHGGSGDS